MISLVDIQKAVIARFKSMSGITNLVPADEIREVQWQGNKFVYPNIRIRCINCVPLIKECDLSKVEINVIVNSDLASSIQADTIAGALLPQIHNSKFTQNAVKFASLWCYEQIGAVFIEGEGVWRSVLKFRAIVS